MIPYGRQEITESDIEAVVAVLRSELITQGSVVPRFEDAVAGYCDAQRAVAVNSGTSALHLACRALDIGPGDTVWTTPITFVASANCARYCGADVDFVDIDPATFNLCPVRLAEKLEKSARAGTLPKAVIPVHFAGLPCDMAAIHELAQRYGFAVIEDAAHAIGARYHDAPIGNGRYSDITVFSFHPVKIITSAEGGMAVTNRDDLAERMERLRSHGITRSPDLMTKAADGPWYYQQIELGYNYRMTELQAALGLNQLDRLDDYVRRRHDLAEAYDDALADLPVTPQYRPGGRHSAYHLYGVRVPASDRPAIFEFLCAQGIGVNLHYIPVHLQPDYQQFGFREGDCPEAERYYSEAMTLPLFPTMSAEDHQKVVRAMHKAVTS